MDPDFEAQIIDHLRAVSLAEKTFDSPVDWKPIKDSRGQERLYLRGALRLDGQLGGGVSLLISTPRTDWERDVYGQLEVRRPGIRAHLRLLPVEWRPRRQHRNPASASDDLKLLTLVDRWHSFEDNAPLGINGFNQTQTGIARDLPRAISSFSDYLNLASEIWKLPDLRTIAPPPWSKTLL